MPAPVTLDTAKRYRIPATRLPFVNTEIAQVTFAGEDHLVSSIYGGGSGGRIYFWHPEKRTHAMRQLPEGVPGAYMLKRGPEGHLYLGCGNGDLWRYDGDADTFVRLVRGELNGLCWGGIITGDYVMWNASKNSNPGAVAVYSLSEQRHVKTFAPLDPGTPTALYGHRCVASPDNKVVWGLGTPVARLAVIDLDTLEADVVTPPALEGNTRLNVNFIDDHTLGVFSGRGHGGEKLYLFEYPSLKHIETQDVPMESGSQHDCGFHLGGTMYRIDVKDGHLFGYDAASRIWHKALDDWTNQTRAVLGIWNQRDIVSVTMFGDALRYRPDTGAIDDPIDLEATGDLAAHALCGVPSEHRIVGAPFINQRFWSIDTSTGQGKDEGRAAPGSGQINQIIWEPQTRHALLSSYTTATITAFDPHQATHWPTNPKVVGSAGHDGQMRPMVLKHDGEDVWMGTSPDYGTLGGALCRYSPKTGAFKAWPHVVTDQAVVALAPDRARKRVLFSTTIHADCHSAPPTQAAAVVAAFDIDRETVIAQRTIDDAAESLWLHDVLPDGRALVCNGDAILTWEVDRDEVTPYAAAPEGFRGIMAVGDQVLVVAAAGIGVMVGSDGERTFDLRLADTGWLAHVHAAGDRLYFAKGFEVFEVELASIGVTPEAD